MQSLTGYTAWKANRLLGRSGAFWHHESYDHAVRNVSEWQRIITYVLNNPVKAGLVDDLGKVAMELLPTGIFNRSTNCYYVLFVLEMFKSNSH